MLFQLPAFVDNIAHASAGTVNEKTSTVTVGATVRTVTRPADGSRAGQLTEGEKREKPDGLARPASLCWFLCAGFSGLVPLGMNYYGLTTRLKVPPNALMPLPLPAGTGAPFDAGASFSLLNR